MKKALSILLCLVLLLCFSSSALAVEPQFANTKAFLALLDSNNITYTVMGLDEEGDEQVLISNKGDKVQYTMNLFFESDNSGVNVRIWNLFDFNESRLGEVIYAVNSVNYAYRYTKWYVDESDYSVTVSWDFLLQEDEHAADIILDTIVMMANCVDLGYEKLEQFDKNASSAT